MFGPLCIWDESIARHFRIEFESGRPIRIRIESRSFARPYLRINSSAFGLEPNLRLIDATRYCNIVFLL